MKNDRLFSILYLLLNRQQTTASALAEKFEVSLRTIYRDIDTLCRAGIPIYTERGQKGGIFLMENCVLDKTSFAKREQDELITAVESAEAVRPDLLPSLSQKLREFFDTQENQKIEIDFTSWKPAERERFILLRQAVLDKKIISFTYHNSRGEISQRKAAPLQLYFKAFAWYMIGFCFDAQEPRMFKLNRIQNLAVTEQLIPDSLTITAYEQMPETFEGITITLKISAHLTYRVYDEFTQEEYTKQEDGSFLVHYTAPENEWLYGYLLSFHPHAKVIAPDFVRAHITALLSESLAIYQEK